MSRSDAYKDKMEKEFNLSEKIQSNDFGSAIWIKDIKEFIKRLKVFVNECYACPDRCNKCLADTLRHIDKSAGSKLS